MQIKHSYVSFVCDADLAKLVKEGSGGVAEEINFVVVRTSIMQRTTVQ